MSTLKRAVVIPETVLTAVAGLVILLIMLGTVANVLMRYLFNLPLPAVYEGSELLMAWLVFGGLAYVEASKANVRSMFVVSKLPSNLQKIDDIFASLVMLVVFAVITWRGAILAIEAIWEAGHVVVVPIPYLPFKMAVPIGGFVACLESFMAALEGIKGYGRSSYRREGA